MNDLSNEQLQRLGLEPAQVGGLQGLPPQPAPQPGLPPEGWHEQLSSLDWEPPLSNYLLSSLGLQWQRAVQAPELFRLCHEAGASLRAEVLHQSPVERPCTWQPVDDGSQLYLRWEEGLMALYVQLEGSAGLLVAFRLESGQMQLQMGGVARLEQLEEPPSSQPWEPPEPPFYQSWLEGASGWLAARLQRQLQGGRDGLWTEAVNTGLIGRFFEGEGESPAEALARVLSGDSGFFGEVQEPQKLPLDEQAWVRARRFSDPECEALRARCVAATRLLLGELQWLRQQEALPDHGYESQEWRRSLQQLLSMRDELECVRAVLHAAASTSPDLLAALESADLQCQSFLEALPVWPSWEGQAFGEQLQQILALDPDAWWGQPGAPEPSWGPEPPPPLFAPRPPLKEQLLGWVQAAFEQLAQETKSRLRRTPGLSALPKVIHGTGSPGVASEGKLLQWESLNPHPEWSAYLRTPGTLSSEDEDPQITLHLDGIEGLTHVVFCGLVRETVGEADCYQSSFRYRELKPLWDGDPELLTLALIDDQGQVHFGQILE